jgi:hypothetical protein
VWALLTQPVSEGLLKGGLTSHLRTFAIRNGAHASFGFTSRKDTSKIYPSASVLFSWSDNVVVVLD